MTNPPPYITILGGGPGGLAAGYFAHQRGVGFRIYEASDHIGGNAITLSHGGFLFDSGAHRFHDEDPQVTREVMRLLGEELQKIDAPSQIYNQGKFIDFPLSPFDLFIKLGPWTFTRAGLELLVARLKVDSSPSSFEALAVRKYGRTIADRFLLSYTEKLWGRPCARLSANIAGRRLKGLDLNTLVKELFLGKRAKVDHLEGAFYYPKHGYGAIVEALADACDQENIQCNARITQINHGNGKVESIEVNGENVVPVDEVVSTLPLTLLVKLFRPPLDESILDEARTLAFRNLVLVVILLNREQVTPNASIYIPDPGIPFTRIYEPKNRSAAMAPAGMTSLCVEFPCDPGDEIWNMPEDELVDLVQTNLGRLGLAHPGELFGHVVHRMSHAYPILELGFEAKIARIHAYLERFSNLKVLGRNGKFLYTHLHDMMRFGMDVMEQYSNAA